MKDSTELQMLWARMAKAEQKLSALQAEIASIRAETSKLVPICNPLLSDSVNTLDLPVRTFICLKRSCIKTVAELVIAYNEDELMSLRNFGMAALRGVEDALDAKGLLTNEAYAEALFLVRGEQKEALGAAQNDDTVENLLDNDGVFLEVILALEHQYEVLETGKGRLDPSRFFHFCKVCDGLPFEILPELVTYLSPDYRIALADYACRNYDTSLISSFSESEDPYIRRALVAATDNQEILNFHAIEDKDAGVRAAVANNRHAKPALLAQLAKDKWWEVRNAVARNKNTEIEVLEMLTVEDPDPTVRESAWQSLNEAN